MCLGDFVTNGPAEWGRDYSDDSEVGKSSESGKVGKSSKSKYAPKLKMSKAKKLHDDLIQRITEFYKKENQWGLITNDKDEVKKLKSIASKLRILRDMTKRNRLRKAKPS